MDMDDFRDDFLTFSFLVFAFCIIVYLVSVGLFLIFSSEFFLSYLYFILGLMVISVALIFLGILIQK